MGNIDIKLEKKQKLFEDENCVFTNNSFFPQFGNFEIFTNKQTNEKFMVFTNLIEKSEIKEIIMERFEEEKNNPKENLVNLISYTVKEKAEFFLTEYHLQTAFEHVYFTLERDILKRMDNSDYFEEKEIWYLLKNIIDSYLFLKKKRKVCHEALDLENIFIDNSGCVKIINYKLIFDNKTAFDNFLNSDLTKKCYLSPYLFSQSKNKKRNLIYSNASKNDVFSLGISILEAATLVSIKKCYDYNHFEMKFDEMESFFDLIQTRYSIHLFEFLKRMLIFDEFARPDFEILELYIEKLISEKNIEIAEFLNRKEKMLKKIDRNKNLYQIYDEREKILENASTKKKDNSYKNKVKNAIISNSPSKKGEFDFENFQRMLSDIKEQVNDNERFLNEELNSKSSSKVNDEIFQTSNEVNFNDSIKKNSLKFINNININEINNNHINQLENKLSSPKFEIEFRNSFNELAEKYFSYMKNSKTKNKLSIHDFTKNLSLMEIPALSNHSLENKQTGKFSGFFPEEIIMKKGISQKSNYITSESSETMSNLKEDLQQLSSIPLNTIESEKKNVQFKNDLFLIPENYSENIIENESRQNSNREKIDINNNIFYKKKINEGDDRFSFNNSNNFYFNDNTHEDHKFNEKIKSPKKNNLKNNSKMDSIFFNNNINNINNESVNEKFDFGQTNFDNKRPEGKKEFTFNKNIKSDFEDSFKLNQSNDFKGNLSINSKNNELNELQHSFHKKNSIFSNNNNKIENVEKNNNDLNYHKKKPSLNHNDIFIKNSQISFDYVDIASLENNKKYEEKISNEYLINSIILKEKNKNRLRPEIFQSAEFFNFK